MASVATWPSCAATFYLVFRPEELENGAFCQGDQAWWALKGNVDGAIRRHAWRCSRGGFEAELARLRCVRFTLTHVGMSAVFLGYVRLELSGWRQHPIHGTWSASAARFAGDLPENAVINGDELWRTGPIRLPDAATCMSIYDSERPPA